MAIKFTAKDQPKAAPVKTPKNSDNRAADSEAATAAPKDAAPAGTDLFDSELKGPATKRKPNGFPSRR
jgi:hypothetical protein